MSSQSLSSILIWTWEGAGASLCDEEATLADVKSETSGENPRATRIIPDVALGTSSVATEILGAASLEQVKMLNEHLALLIRGARSGPVYGQVDEVKSTDHSEPGDRELDHLLDRIQAGAAEERAAMREFLSSLVSAA
jgi:hypothetical protein